MSIETTFVQDIRGNCDICLTSECGPAGVRVEGTPVAVGRTCVERLAAVLPTLAGAAATAEPSLARVERAAFASEPTDPPASPPASAKRTQRRRSRGLAGAAA